MNKHFVTTYNVYLAYRKGNSIQHVCCKNKTCLFPVSEIQESDINYCFGNIYRGFLPVPVCYVPLHKTVQKVTSILSLSIYV